MFDSSPLPLTLLGLWATLPGIWLGAGALTELLPADRLVRRILQPAAAVAGWIVAVQCASMAAHSFWVGLPVGMISLAIAGLALWWLRRSAGTATQPADDDVGVCPSRGMWVGLAVVMGLVAILAFKGHFHDLLLPNGHMSFTAQLQNDYFPPRYLGFTDVPLKYHYGCDLVAGGVTALTRLRIDWAIDAVAVAACAYLWCLLWTLGARLTDSAAGGSWIAAATMLGGGAAAFLAPLLSYIPWRERLIGTETFEVGMPLNPPVVSYLFQRPFTAGFPLALAALLLAIDRPKQSTLSQRVARQVLLGFSLAALSLVQAVLFVALGAALVFTEVVLARRWQFLTTLAAAWGLAWCMGGMLFTHIPGGQAFGFQLRFWPTTVPDSLHEPAWHWALRVLAWNGATYGILLPLGILGIWHARRLRWMLLLLVLGGVATPLCIGLHPYLKNISKFSTVAALALGILSGVALNWLAAKRTVLCRLVLLGCAAALMTSSVVWIGTTMWILFFDRQTPPPTEVLAINGAPVPLDADDRQVLAWLRMRVKPDEIVYRLPETAIGYCQWGGLPATSATIRFPLQFGVAQARVDLLEHLLVERPAELTAFQGAGIVWFVVGPDDPIMERRVRDWAAAGQVRPQAQFGALRVYKVGESQSVSAAPVHK